MFELTELTEHDLLTLNINDEPVCLFGDFNSRTANKSDFTKVDECLINGVDNDNEIYNQL